MILGEFAVDPAVIDDWNDLKVLTMNFGFHNGAVISNFPPAWIGLLKQKAKKELDGTREYLEIVERLKLLKDEYFVKRAREFSDKKSWVENAVQENDKDPFYKIINSFKAEAVKGGIVFADVDETLFNDLRDGYCHRHAIGLAEEARLLLECSKHIKIIDPFISSHRGYKATIKEILDIAILQNRRPNVCVEVHASAMQGGREVDIDREKGAFLDDFPQIIPRGSVLKIYWWNDPNTNEIHPRYLVSERGGVKYDRGFLEPNELTEKDSNTDVSMMTRKKVDEVWNQYTPETSKYNVIDQVVIEGMM